jgi:aminopeptidase N
MAIAEITRDETRERAGLLRVDAYEVELDLLRGDEVFGSRTTVRFHAAEPGASTYIDLIAEAVRGITLNGRALDPVAVYAEGRIALADLAADNELVIDADCAYVQDSAGMHRAVDPVDGKPYVYTNFEPAEARKVYANFEQPDLKGTFAFTVLTPENWTVLSNQPTPQPEAAAPGAARWAFAPTPRMATYTTNVTAGEFHVVRESHTTPRGQVIPLGLACRASLAESLEPGDVFEITRQGLDFFTGLFERDYPFEKYDQVFVPEFSAGAMENPGCVTISEMMVFRSKVTDAMYELRALVILHEMAHMWFGDFVTMRWWDDLWLNESFAEFAGSLASAEATRFTGAWTSFANSRKAWGYMQDQLPSTHPIAANVGTLSEAIGNFDGISYAKGASVLKQLVAHVGREEFFAGVRAYFTEHAWGNATLGDLLGRLEDSGGKSLAEWSKAWLESAGPNTLRAAFELDAAGAYSSFAVLQEASPEHPTLRPHRIAIGFYNRRDGVLVRDRRIEIDVEGARTDLPELVGAGQPDLLLLNDDDLGYALIRFDERSLETVVGSIGEFTDSLPRAVCWSAATDMVSQAEMSLPDFLHMVVNGTEDETSVTVLQTLHMILGLSIRLLADPAWLPQGRRTLAEVAERRVATAEPGGDHQLAWAQLLGTHATSDTQLDLVAGLLDGSREVPGLAVDTELRWLFLLRLAATGRAAEADIDAELERDPSDAGQRYAHAARASIPDAAHKAAAWELLISPDGLGVQGIAEVASAFRQSDHSALLTPYADKYFDLLPTLWAERTDRVRQVLAQTLFPHFAASPELVARADAFLATPDLDPGLARIVLEGRDGAERALKSRALPSRG